MNEWCNFAHNHQCSFAGVYQPDLPPPGNFGDFYGFGQLLDIWEFIEMEGDYASVREYYTKARRLCEMNWKELKKFNKGKDKKHMESR